MNQEITDKKEKTTMTSRAGNWLLRYIHKPYFPTIILSLSSFTESSFFIIPPDLILIPLTALRPKRWWYYALVTTATSILGALFGYLIGSVLYETVGLYFVELYNLQDEMAQVGEIFTQNAFWGIFVSGFTPIPFKVFTIASGVFRVNLVTLVVASLLGRGLRYFLEALLMRFLGERLTKLIYRYFAWGVVALVAAIIALIILRS